nr:MAG TPA: hypothetical protein [Caudoviricetes sp.]
MVTFIQILFIFSWSYSVEMTFDNFRMKGL